MLCVAEFVVWHPNMAKCTTINLKVISSFSDSEFFNSVKHCKRPITKLKNQHFMCSLNLAIAAEPLVSAFG